MKKKGSVDTIFIVLAGILVVIGIFVFISAAFSVLAENEKFFYEMLFNQIILGLGGGILTFLVALKLPTELWRKYALWLLLGSIVLTALVFIPGLGVSHGGATRWIDIGPFSFQPAELLKLGFVVYFAAWLAWVKKKIGTVKWGLLPFLLLCGLVSLLLLLQPDTGTLLVILISGGVMFFVGGAKWKHIGVTILIAIIGFGVLIAVRPYLIQRIETFVNPAEEPLGDSYQVQQSLIAIGSGGITGRGYGQSVQKFNYLPEPTGDSVFAIIGEEFGFMGSLLIILLYVLLFMRGLRIAKESKTVFGRHLVVGLITMITVQSFLNIGSMLAITPLTGLPLIFISQGGTALLFALLEAGIIVNISRHKHIHK